MKLQPNFSSNIELGGSYQKLQEAMKGFFKMLQSQILCLKLTETGGLMRIWGDGRRACWSLEVVHTTRQDAIASHWTA
jgi:hypothetical protein